MSGPGEGVGGDIVLLCWLELTPVANIYGVWYSIGPNFLLLRPVYLTKAVRPDVSLIMALGGVAPGGVAPVGVGPGGAAPVRAAPGGATPL